MNRLYRIIGPCIVVTSLGLELFLGEERHKHHIELRQPEIQAELTNEISYSTDSRTRTQFFSTFYGRNARLQVGYGSRLLR